ncbi:hypothetical protein HYE66_02750 [Aggregatibacter actinomycetemcomitans]|nr:hypothetical protein [Aggregatibacter actinomycetemcomitans]
MNIKDSIYELVEQNCTQKEECIVDFKDLLLKEDNVLHIFNNPAKAYVQEKIGMGYDLYEDIGDKIILVKDGEIKSYYELFPSAENLDRDILFSFHYDGKYFPFYKITSKDSKLKAKKLLLTDKKGKSITRYKLSPISYQQISY